MLEEITLVLVVIAFYFIGISTYLWMKLKALESDVYSMPNPQEVFEAMLKNKIPVVLGPDGAPMIQPGNVPTTRNPIAG